MYPVSDLFTMTPELGLRLSNEQREYRLGSTKFRGLERRDRLVSDGRAGVRSMDVQLSMLTTLTSRIVVLP